MEINTRALTLEILLEVEAGTQMSHIVLGRVLAKYQYLSKSDRAFITRLTGGTIERRITLDYILDAYSKVKVRKMKPVIRNILRMSLYQIFFMDHIPESAAVDEAVKLAAKKHFGGLRGFVNGVLRAVIRDGEQIRYPDKSDPADYLSVRYSVPRTLARDYVEAFGFDLSETICASYLEVRPTTVRLTRTGHDADQTLKSLADDGAVVCPAHYLPEARYISGYDHIGGLAAHQDGAIQVQDESSMLVGRIANPAPGAQVLDLCAAPGGKSLHIADLLDGTGHVEARDVSDYKAARIRENIDRLGLTNIDAAVRDATCFHEADKGSADIVLVDAPCSGLGVVAKKPEIKYGYTKEKLESLVVLQRKILANAASYVKPGGLLIYSTCTITKAENEENAAWFLQHFPYESQSFTDRLPKELIPEVAKSGTLQLLPGVHACDGFFIAAFRKNP